MVFFLAHLTTNHKTNQPVGLLNPSEPTLLMTQICLLFMFFVPLVRKTLRPLSQSWNSLQTVSFSDPLCPFSLCILMLLIQPHLGI